MAGISALGTNYNLPNYTGILHYLTPADTPFFSAVGGLTGGRQTTSTEFEWQTHGGAHYDYFIVKCSVDISPLIFKEHRESLELVASSGWWWLYRNRARASAASAHAEEGSNRVAHGGDL